jgi:sarcosine oxidase subunit beta
MGVIGWEPSIRGMIHACGFSGHGFMHAPATGVLVAELVLGQKLSIEISELRPDRFGVEELVEEGNVI